MITVIVTDVSYFFVQPSVWNCARVINFDTQVKLQ